MQQNGNAGTDQTPSLDHGSLFHHAVEAMAAAVFIFQGTSLTYVNPATADLTGYTPDELLNMDFWKAIHPDFETLVKERAMARKRGEAVPSRYEVKIVRKDGETRWVDFCAGTIQLDGERAIVGSAYDITDKKLAEAELKQGHEDLERRVRERTATLSAARPTTASTSATISMGQPFVGNARD